MDDLSKGAASYIAAFILLTALPIASPPATQRLLQALDDLPLFRAWLLLSLLFLMALAALTYVALTQLWALATKNRLGAALILVCLLATALLLLATPFPSPYALGITLFLVITPLAASTSSVPTFCEPARRWTPIKPEITLKTQRGASIPISNPQLGIFILGAPGSGKTKYLVEPILFNLIRKGYAGIIYDYDFSTQGENPNYSLSTLTHHLALASLNPRLQALSINFQDPCASTRVNPIDPAFIADRKQLSATLKILLSNLSADLAQKEDFWVKNTYALLKALVVLLANQYPMHCTLPQVIMLGLQPTDKLLALIKTDSEASLYASPIFDAAQSAPEQLAGVMASFKVGLDTLIDPHLFWVLGAQEFPLTINDPSTPYVICLGNTPTEKQTLAPVIAMTLSMLAKRMYGHNRSKSFILLDELPTLYLPQLSEIPATARKYGIATIVALQNLAQLEKTYGSTGAQELQEAFSNQFVGRSQYGVSKLWSEQLGTSTKEQVARTYTEGGLSRTVSEKDTSRLTPQALMTLEVGEFVGRIPERGMFQRRFAPLSTYDRALHYKHLRKLPLLRKAVDVHAHFEAVERNAQELIAPF
ncbi:MAG: type IV secretory system conjugative DNA transfer family protein [Roseivirga sp.]